jgi:hypothetical protein
MYLGWFDGELRPDAWFDAELEPVAWWDVELLNSASSSGVNLTPTLFSNTNTFYSPSVSVGAVNLAPTLFSNTNNVYPPSIAVGSVTLSPELFINSNNFYVATITGGDITVEVVDNSAGPSRHKQRRIHPRIIFAPIEDDEDEPIVVIDKKPKQKKPRVPPQFIEFEPLRTETKPLPIDRSREIERERLRAIEIEDEEILLLI